MAVRDKSVQIIISAEVASALRAFDSVGKAIHKFSVQTEQIGRAIDGVFSPLMRGLTTAVTAIGAGMGMLAKSALTVGGDFELTMKRVGGVTTATGEQFDEMTAKARKLGEELPISAQQAAEAMYSLSSAGMEAEETLSAIDAVVGLSIAQNYDLAQSANLMTATLRGFGLAAGESGRVADVFNNAIASSMLNMEKLGEAITYVAPVAKSLGISIEETAAAMGKLADSGLRGEQIGTALRAIMLQLLDPTAEAAAELQRLGVTVTDTTGKLRPLDQIFTDLKASGMTAAEAVRIFDQRSVAAALTLSEVSGELKEYSEELGKLGRTQKLVADMMDTFKNKAIAVKSALQETLLVVFDQIEEQSKGVADELVKLVKVFNDWAKETQVFRKVIDALFEGFGLVTGNVELFAQALKSIDVDMITGQFKSFAEGVRALFDSFWNLASKIDWKGLISNLDKVATGIATGWAVGKMFLITAAVSGFANSILLLGKNIVSLAGVVAANPIIGAMVATAAGVTSIIDSVDKLLQVEKDIAGYNAEAERMEQIARDYTEALEGNIVALGNLPKKYQDLVNEQLKVRAETGKLNEAFGESASIAMQMSGDILRGLGTVEEKISGLSQIWETGIMNAFALGGKEGVDKFLTQFERLPQDMQDIMRKVADAAIKGAEEIGKAGEVTKTFSDSVSEGIQKALDEYQKYAVEMTAKTKELIAATGINANEAWAVMETDLKAKAQATSKGLVDEFKNPAVAAAFAQAFGGMAKAAGDEMTLRISDALNDVKSAISAISAEARKAIDEFLKGMEDLAPAFQNLQLQQVRETTDSITFVADNGMSKIIRVYDKATGEIKDVSQTIADSGRDSSKAFELAARDIEAAGRGTGTAWTTGAIEPLKQTGETAKTTGAAIGALSAEAVKVADGFKAAIDGIDAAISTMGQRMVSALSVAVEGLKTVFEQIGIDSGNSMMTALNRQVEAAIPSLSTTAANAGMSMGQSMGRSLESAMQTSLQNIARAVDAMARRAASAVPAAAGSGGNVDAAALAAAYAREG